LPDRELVH